MSPCVPQSTRSALHFFVSEGCDVQATECGLSECAAVHSSTPWCPLFVATFLLKNTLIKLVVFDIISFRPASSLGLLFGPYFVLFKFPGCRPFGQHNHTQDHRKPATAGVPGLTYSALQTEEHDSCRFVPCIDASWSVSSLHIEICLRRQE